MGGLLDGDVRSTEYHFRCLFHLKCKVHMVLIRHSVIETVLLIYVLQKKIARPIDCCWTAVRED